MGNLVLAIICISLAALTALIIRNGIADTKRARLTPYLLFLSLMVLAWQLLKILFYLAQSPALILYLYDTDLPFTAFCGMAGLLFIMRFYSKDLYVSKTVFGALAVIPAFALILVLCRPGNNFFRMGIEILSMKPFRIIQADPGPWFWIIIFYNLIMIALCIGISMVQHRSLSRGYRLPSTLLITGLWIILVSGIIDYFFPLIDIALYAVSICNLFVFYATRNNLGKEFLVTARNEIFKNMHDAVFITDDEGVVVNKNNAANTILKLCGVGQELVYFTDVYDSLKRKSREVEIMQDADEGAYFYLGEDPDETVYHVIEKELSDRKKTRIGKFIICHEVTENKRIMNYLEKEGGLDPLTGLSNRRKNKIFISELDNRQNLPLGVLVGDVDNLKAINEQYGHQMGDMVMRVSAEAFNFCCPSNCRISRIGGDEFLVLLPNTGFPRLSQLVNDILNHLSSIRSLPFPVSLSLGFSVKEKDDQRLSEITDTAYGKMLEYKRNKKMKSMQPPSVPEYPLR